ncbi:MAG: Glutamate racemase [uncultured bacterium]|nr:MAG: Glutamate racemase [uncultured bacterium]HBR71494.1 glutamate racemase [Candidatus Moranbacteria bacterium]
MNKNKPIGIFDSGFGGLNIMKGIVKELPKHNYVYLGDTARVPYGSRSKEIIYEFTKQAADFLFSKKCELIIFACNTASSDALRRIQQEYLPVHYPNKKVLGVIIPVAELAVTKTKNKRIGIMATEGTVSSGSFMRELLKIDNGVKIYQNACPLLAPIVEAGEHNSKIVDILLKKYLKPLINKKIDTLILGCTHYGIFESKIRKIVGKDINVISEEKIVAKKLKDYLLRHPEIERELTKGGLYDFYSTDLTDKFNILGSRFFGKKIEAKKAII